MRETSRLAFHQVPPHIRSRIERGALDAEITLERMTPRMLDSDNWVSACKGVRDGIADACGVADNAPHIRFFYTQVSSTKKEVWAVLSVIPTASGYTSAWLQKLWETRARAVTKKKRAAPLPGTPTMEDSAT